MAATCARGRALRKYAKMDMVCSAELSDVVDEATEPLISIEQLTQIKIILGNKHLRQKEFARILFDLFGHTNYTSLTKSQGITLVNTLSNYISENTESE